MSKIDAALLSAIEESGDKRIGVLITSRSDCAALAETLESEGIPVKQIMPDINVISADISEGDLKTLQKFSDVEAVEVDAVASID